jgi:uracil-DNA glycosylase
MKILFVGSNPGNASPDCSAFHPTSRSRIVLDSWLKDLDVEAAYINVYDQKTENNKPLSIRQIKESIPSLRNKISLHRSHKIVAVGVAASKALELTGVVEFLSIPHPSGRTRSYNDKNFTEQTVKTLISFIKGYNINTGV